MKAFFLWLFVCILSFNLLAMQEKEKLESITLGAGCFWCVEAVYQELQGVVQVESGYMGGSTKNPTYKEVCTGNTGHAEVVRVTYNPAIISLKQILEVFFQVHDPTTLNRQGNDVGTQYRSVIFYDSNEQKELALEVKRALTIARIWPDPIVTEISPLSEFYLAENYHQDYYSLNSDKNPYCSFVITPKMEKFRKTFKELLKE
jgi:peptide-methionine (S)-S-oxide reductase